MARILVTGDTDALAPRMLLERLVETIRADGHDAALAAGLEDPAREVRDADAVVALLDKAEAGASALVAYAHAQRKPVLGCLAAGGSLPPALRAFCTQVAQVRKGSEIPAALTSFYEKVRPFAGRLVRDRVPDLVREAGHEVRFRRLAAEEVPRFLKRKVAEEAHALEAAEGGREREELSDLLEALEAFIAARGLDREELKRVKARKREERGGFDQGFVVEAATTTEAATSPEQAPPARRLGGEAAGAPRRASGQRARAVPPPPAGYDGPVWEADDAVPAGRDPQERPSVDRVGPARDVRAELHDL